MTEKTCSTCQCNKVCDHNKHGFEDCGNYISADVVPKSDFERLEHTLNSYALQYGTVKDQHSVIDCIKAAVAREIMEIIRNYARESMENNDYEVDTVDMSAELCTRIERYVNRNEKE